MRPGKLRRGVAALVVLAGAALLLLVPLPDQYRARWLAKLLDMGHLPLFAAVAWCFVRALGRGREWPALAAMVGAAVVFELLQLLTGRNAQAGDVVYAALGGLVVVTFARRGSAERSRPVEQTAAQTTRALLPWRMLALAAAAAWTAIDAVPTLADAWLAWRAFPVASDFRSPWEPRRWQTENAELVRHAGSGTEDRSAGRLTFLPSDGTSGAVLFPVRADWSGYRRLVWEFRVEDEPLELLFSVRDGRRVEPPQVRFDLWRTYPPGRHRVVLDLEQLARGGGEVAPLDLTRVQSVHVVAQRLSRPQRVWLERILLE